MVTGAACVTMAGTSMMLLCSAGSSTSVTLVCAYILEQSSMNFRVSTFSVSGIVSYGGGTYGQGIGPVNVRNVACTGSERSLFSCPYDGNTAGCTHAEDAGVRCHSCKLFVYSCRASHTEWHS